MLSFPPGVDRSVPLVVADVSGSPPGIGMAKALVITDAMRNVWRIGEPDPRSLGFLLMGWGTGCSSGG